MTDKSIVQIRDLALEGVREVVEDHSLMLEQRRAIRQFVIDSLIEDQKQDVPRAFPFKEGA